MQIDGRKIDLYVRFLKYILKPTIQKNVVNLENFQIDSLWKYGISGDNPIIIVKVKNIEDMYVIEDVITAYEYYRAKKIFIDLIILNEEIDVYERYVKENIMQTISNKQLDYLKNIDTGIFVLNKDEILKDDLEVIEFKARLIIDCSKNDIESFIRDFEEEECEEKLKKEI